MKSNNEFVSRKREEQKERSAMEQVVVKRDKYGSFALTAQDHRDLKGRPEERLTGDNEGKALYEVMTNEEIEEILDETADNMYDDSHIGEILRQKMKSAIRFLHKVDRLPKKYQNFDTSKL